MANGEIRRASGGSATRMPQSARSGSSRTGPGGVKSAPVAALHRASSKSGGTVSQPQCRSNSNSGSGGSVGKLKPTAANRNSRSTSGGESGGSSPAKPGTPQSPGGMSGGMWPHFQMDELPYANLHTANFQKFRPPTPDVSKVMGQRVTDALKRGDYEELCEVYRNLCNRNNNRFLVPSSQVTKVVQKIKQAATAGLRKSLKSGDMEECREILAKVEAEPILVSMLQSPEVKQVHLLSNVAQTMKKVETSCTAVKAKRETAIPQQEEHLQALHEAIRAAQTGGLDPEGKTMKKAREAEEKLDTKLRAWEALQAAVASEDIDRIDAGLTRAAEAGVAPGEVRFYSNMFLETKLEVYTSSPEQCAANVEELRSVLQDIQKADGLHIDSRKIQQGWRMLHHQDLMIAMRTESAKKLRLAIAYAQAAGLAEGETQQTLQAAEMKLEELDIVEEKVSIINAKLQKGILFRDVNLMRDGLNQAQSQGLDSMLIEKAMLVLCEEELRMAVSMRLANKVACRVLEGMALGIDKELVASAMQLLRVDPKGSVWDGIRQSMSAEDADKLWAAVHGELGAAGPVRPAAKAVEVGEVLQPEPEEPAEEAHSPDWSAGTAVNQLSSYVSARLEPKSEDPKLDADAEDNHEAEGLSAAAEAAEGEGEEAAADEHEVEEDAAGGAEGEEEEGDGANEGEEGQGSEYEEEELEIPDGELEVY